MTSPIGAVNGTTAYTGTSTSGTTGMSSLVQPTTFLKMLVDEIKYQDPLNPTSSSSFMAQLAQLSQVEQLNTMSTSMQLSEAAGLLGKTIDATGPNGAPVSGIVTDVINGANGPTLDVGGTFVDLSSVSKIGS